jgi:glutaredoxin
MTLIVYSKENCAFCDRAKNLLNLKNIPYTEVRVDQDPQARQFIIDRGHRTVPQIYLDDQLFVENGYSGLSQMTEVAFQQLKEQLNVSKTV